MRCKQYSALPNLLGFLVILTTISSSLAEQIPSQVGSESSSLSSTVTIDSSTSSASSSASSSAVSVSTVTPTLCINPSATSTVSSLYSLLSTRTGGLQFGYEAEKGRGYGNVIIQNNCEEDLFLNSVGSWPLGGPRLKDTPGGLGTHCDLETITIRAGQAHSEPYRTTCPIFPNVTDFEKEYCIAEDKVAGQGIALKIGKTEDAAAGGLSQFEYALIQDPNRNDKFYRLNYDVSLLDCGPGGSDITDSNAQQDHIDNKTASCPGLKGGLAVTFSNDSKADNCPPIHCQEGKKCPMIYMWDRTRSGEASLACEKEYYGDMKLDLCVARNPAQYSQASSAAAQWSATATNRPSIPSSNP